MPSQSAIIARTRSLIKTLHSNYANTTVKTITTFPSLSQEPQLAESPSPAAPTPLPPNPASGSPLYNENWRSPIPPSATQSVIPLGFLNLVSGSRIQTMAQTFDVKSLMDQFADWVTSQEWAAIKDLFESWVKSLDKSGKPNKPDVNLYNHYLRANLMIGASAGELLDLLAGMEEFGVAPNTASFNLVLKAMYHAKETEAAEKLLERMLLTGNESRPDNESYDLVIGMLFLTGQIDAALKYIELALKSSYMLSMNVFTNCVNSCIKKGRLDTLAAIIEKCKTMDQNKALCPPWNVCHLIAETAMELDNSKLAFYALEFIAMWIARGEHARPPAMLSVDEGLVVSALATAGRTYSTNLLDAAWAILRRSLRQRKAPNPESYLGKISAIASMGSLQRAFSTLHDFEVAYGDSSQEAEEMFSPFTSLHPLVVACCKKGFETLDSVYFQLENLSQAETPYKSVAALNCVILGCANIWDLERAYQTFEAIGSTFGLTPDIHSYNALMHAFGKLKKTHEATKVFEHIVSSGVKPNSMSYSLLVDAHLMNRNVKDALTVIDDMVAAGFEPTKEMLKKVRRRCMREMDYDSDDRVQSFARSLNIRMGPETRRDMLFNLDYSMDYA